MIWHWIWFVLGFLCGMIAMALAVISHESDRVGRPPRREP